MPSSAVQTMLPPPSASPTTLEPQVSAVSDQSSDSATTRTDQVWPNFFEGAEKRLVIYFAGPKDLRLVPRSTWESVLDLVNCRVLSVMSNEHQDAYLLSESSMFVSRRRVLIKTCGSTTLLHCLEQMLKIGLKVAGFGGVQDCFYSHKNLLLPDAQLHPHQCFGKESDYLDKVFDQDGLALQLGGDECCSNLDRFYLYSLNNHQPGPLISVNNNNEHFKFELIMEQLDPQTMAHFLYNNSPANKTAAEVTRKSGIAGLIPGMLIDDWLFEPCGYSMNGILGDHLMTIHITPEPDFSYVSVETDLPMIDRTDETAEDVQSHYGEFLTKAVRLFKPRKFMLNLIVPRSSSPSIRRELLKAPFFCSSSMDLAMPSSTVRLVRLNAHLDVIYARFSTCD